MHTVDSRRSIFQNYPTIRRRRVCLNHKCRKRCTTYEMNSDAVDRARAGEHVLEALQAALMPLLKARLGANR